jgi:hypothetical protein
LTGDSLVVFQTLLMPLDYAGDTVLQTIGHKTSSSLRPLPVAYSEFISITPATPTGIYPFSAPKAETWWHCGSVFLRRECLLAFLKAFFVGGKKSGRSETSAGWNFSRPERRRFPLTLQKPRMPQIQGVEGDAVVIYREPSTTHQRRTSAGDAVSSVFATGKQHGYFSLFLDVTPG